MYKYAGKDFRLKPFELPYSKSESNVICKVDETDSNKLEISMTLEKTPMQDEEAYLLAAMYRALEYEKKGIPYATTGKVFAGIEYLRDAVIYWKKLNIPGKEWMVYPILKHESREMQDERYKAFKKRWGKGEHND